MSEKEERMYYTDEALDEWAEALTEDRERAERERLEVDTEVAEDLAQQREAEECQADCGHENASEEPGGYVHRNGAVELYLVCPDCGLTRPTGRYDSVL